MTLSEKLITWGDMDIAKITNVYNNIAPIIVGKLTDKITRNEIKLLMEEALPEYIIKCDEENNPPKVIDSGNIIIRISTKIKPDKSYNYIDVIF